MKYPARGFMILLVLCLATQRNVVNFGAVGNGSHDDTAAINSAIAAMQVGDELYFPCPSAFYLISSALTTINVQNVTIDGQTGCSSGPVMIKANPGSYPMMTIGSESLSASTPFTASSAELSTTFQANLSAIGVGTGDYVFLKEGDTTYGNYNYDGDGMNCSVSGCRAETLKVANASGNTATVATALHYLYDTTLPSNDAPVVKKLLNPTSGTNMHDLILDGGGNGSGTGAGYGLLISVAVNLTFTNLTIQNVGGASVYARYLYNVTFNNVNQTHCSGQYGACFDMRRYSQVTINGMAISLLNTVDGSDNFSPYEGTDSTFTNVTADRAPQPGQANHGGRPWKYNATSYTTVNGAVVKNGCVVQSGSFTCTAAGGTEGSGFNGISLEYYSRHNTFSNCRVINNGGDGIVGFNNGNDYNTLQNCTMYGNGIYQFGGSSSDNNWTVGGGTYGPGWSDQHVIGFSCCGGVTNNIYVHDATIKGPGDVGLSVGGASNACINNNTFISGTGIISAGISVNTNDIGSGNVLNGLTSNLTAATCGGGTGPAPPTGLTATVQ